MELIPQGTVYSALHMCIVSVKAGPDTTQQLNKTVRGAGSNIPLSYSVRGLHTLYADGKLPKKGNNDGSIAAYNKRERRKFGNKEYLLRKTSNLPSSLE